MLSQSSFVNEVGPASKLSCASSVLYVRKIEVSSSHRGLGLGLFLLDAADRQLHSGPSSLTLLIPFPLIYTKGGACSDVDACTLQREKLRLGKYYALIGFKEAGWAGTNSYFMGRAKGLGRGQEERTRVDNVLPHLFKVS